MALCCLHITGSILGQQKPIRKPQLPVNETLEQAVEIAFRAGLEASDISEPSEKIQEQLSAATILVDVRPDAALRLTNAAWNSLESSIESDNDKVAQRDEVFLGFRNRILQLYMKLDPVRASRLKATLAEARDEVHDSKRLKVSEVRGRAQADEMMLTAIAEVDSAPANALATALSSISTTNKLSTKLARLVYALQNRPEGRPFVDQFERQLAKMLSYRTSMDGDDLQAVADVVFFDSGISHATQVALLEFLLRSTEQIAATVVEAKTNRRPLSLNPDQVGHVYFVIVRNVRKSFLKYDAQSLEQLDRAANEISSALSDTWRELAYEGANSDSWEGRIKRALDTPRGSLRDSRLARFTLRALSITPAKLDLASQAIDELGNDRYKETFAEYLAMARAADAILANDFEIAEKYARNVSQLDWRAWSLLAIGSVRDGAESTRLFDEALQTLEKADASPRKVELLLRLADLWGTIDLTRAAEVELLALKVSNKTKNVKFDEVGSFDLNGFFVRIGKLNFAPGMPIDRLAEVPLPEIVGRLALNDWGQALRNSDSIEDRSFRIRYRLLICKSILSSQKDVKRILKASDR